MAGLGGGASATRELRWLVTAQDATRIGLNSAIIAMEQLAMSAERVNYRMLLAGTAMVVGGGLIVKSMTSCVDAAKDFDVGLRNIQSISRDMTEGELASMGDAILDLSMKYPQSADVLVKSMYEIYSAEYEGAEAMKLLEVASMGASAGLTSTDTIIRMLIGVLKSYGMSVDDSTRLMDEMFNAVDIGIFNFEELAGSFGKIISTAAQLNVPFSEILSAYVLLTNKGQTLANAQIGLQRAFIALLKPSEDMVKWIDKAGYSSGQAMIATEGLGGLLTRLRNDFRLVNIEVPENIKVTEDYAEVMEWLATTSVMDAEKLAALFPTIQGLRAILGLCSGSAEDFATTLDSIAGKTGTTMDALAQRQKAYDYQLSLFKDTIGVIKVKIGQFFLPALIDLVSGFKDMMQKILAVNPAITDFIAKAMGIGAITLIIGGLVTIFSSFAGGVFSLLSVVTLLPAAGWAIIAVGMAIITNFEEMKGVINDLKGVVTVVFDILKVSFMAMAGVVKFVIDIIADLVSWLSRIGLLRPLILGFIGAFIGLKVITPIILSIVGGMKMLFGIATNMGGAFSALSGWLIKSASSMIGYASATTAAKSITDVSTAATGTFSTALSGMATGGITIAITALAGLAFALWQVSENKKKLYEEAEKIKVKMVEEAGKITECLTELDKLNAAQAIAVETGEGLVEAQTNINNKLTELASLVPQAVEAYDYLTGAYTINTEAARAQAEAVALMGQAHDDVAQALYEGESAMLAYEQAQVTVQLASDTYKNSIWEMEQVLGTVEGGIGNLRTVLQAYATDQADGAKSMQAYIEKLWDMQKAESQAAQERGASAEELTAIDGYWDNIILTMKNAETSINSFGNTYGFTVSQIDSQRDAITKGMKSTIDSIVESARTAGKELGKLPEDVIWAIKQSEPGYKAAGVQALTEYFTGEFEALGLETPVIIQAVTSLIPLLTDLDLASRTGQRTAIQLISGTLTELEIGQEKIIEVIQKMFPEISKEDITAYITGQGLSNSITDGMTNGLNIEKFKEKLKSQVQAAVDSVKKILGIDSPSKVFAYMGEMVGEGLVVGIESMEGKTERAVEKLINIPKDNLGYGYGNEGGYGVEYDPSGVYKGNSSSHVDNTKKVYIENVNLPGVKDSEGFMSGLELEINRV